MEEINELKGRMNKLENNLFDTKIRLEKNNVLTEQNTKVLERVNDTMIEVQKTMVAISYELKDNKEVNQELKGNIGKLDKKVTNLENRMAKRVRTLDDKGKLDIVIWLKDHFVELVLSCGVIYSVLISIK